MQMAIASHHRAQLPRSEHQLRGEAVGLFDAGRFDEAATCYRQLLALRPEDADIQHRLGVCLHADNRPQEAIPHYRAALARNLDSAACHCDLGLACQETGRHEEAEAVLSRAVSRYSDHAPSHYNLATTLLARGILERGWREYQWRLRLPDKRVRRVPLSPWQGEDLRGGGLLVFAEQGVGDEVMYSSCIPDLLRLDAGAVYLECDPRLQPLFARSFPGARVTGQPRKGKPDWTGLFPDCDKAVAIASLPQRLRNRESDFPGMPAYLTPDPEAVIRWRRRYAALGELPKIGISWRGGRLHKEKRQRTTALADWASLLRCDAIFVNLQYGDCRDELAQARREPGVGIHDWEDADPLANLDDFAAQVSALDLVISVDNSTVHFAGALGVPVWNLLPQPAEFRWMLGRDDTPWYPSMRLFRSSGDWRALLDEVGRELGEFLRRGVSG